jgi:putative MATE family efflux protein
MTDTELSLQKDRTAEQGLPALSVAEGARKRDLTTGSIHRNIWTLAVPMILEMGTLSVTQIVDTYWVGKLGSAALAAVTISMTLRWVMNSLANGLGIGGMAVVARRTGARDRAQADHATWQTVLLAAFVSLVLGAVGILLAEPALRLLGADTEVLAMGVSFLRIVFGGLFTLVLVFVINSLLRGAGEARLALWVLVLSQGLTVVLEPLLIFGWGPFPALGVDGSAWAGVLGFGAGVLFQITILLSGRARIAINFHDLWPDLPLMWHIVKIALPSTVQMTVRSTSRLIILAIVGLYGIFATAGFGVANRILLVALIPGFGLGNAAAHRPHPGLWPGQRRRHSGGAEPGRHPAPSGRAQRLVGHGLQRWHVGCLCDGVLHLLPPADRLLRPYAGGCRPRRRISAHRGPFADL